MAANDTINMWQHEPGNHLEGDSVMGISTHEYLLDFLRKNIADGSYLFESLDPDEGLELFEHWCQTYLGSYNETGEFSEWELEALSEHLWNGSVRFDERF